jgi:hypothetical protein
MSTPQTPAKGRFGQMRQAYTLTKRTDPKLPLVMLATFLVAALVFAGIGLLLLGTGVVGIIASVFFGLLSGVLSSLIVFGRRAEKSAYAQVEGTPGAAAGVLEMLRGGWQVKAAIAFNRNQDVVHRVVGRPGVILVAEGEPTRVRSMLTAEKKKHARIVGEAIPITEVLVGRGEGQVPLPKLARHVKKLPKAVKPAEQTEALNKLKALDAMRPVAPVPRGPMPSMKGARRAMRG